MIGFHEDFFWKEMSFHLGNWRGQFLETLRIFWEGLRVRRDVSSCQAWRWRLGKVYDFLVPPGD
jgi:hypothetical protein